jgi:hypothetical protein
VPFGQNGDRERNKAQLDAFTRRADRAPGSKVACTYITIPQARRTHAVLLCRPFWIWGVEMGANERGMAIALLECHCRGGSCPRIRTDVAVERRSAVLRHLPNAMN